MAQGKQAKILTSVQIRTALQFLQSTRYSERDLVMFLLSVKAGLRAQEIALVTWGMLTDAEGRVSNAIVLEDTVSKGTTGGRTIPLHKDLKNSLECLNNSQNKEALTNGNSFSLSSRVIRSERGAQMSPNSVAHWFKRLYDSLGFYGCSSHSGRRTAITGWARNISRVSGSLRDVQVLAGHSSLAMTQLYIEQNTEAQRKLIDIV